MSAREELLDRVVAWFVEHGVGDTSLRTVAAGVGTSHRMLHYHFGSRDGLLAAVVEASWVQQQGLLSSLLEEAEEPYDAAWAFWSRLADTADTFGPLFFELSAAAMHGHGWAESLRGWIDAWIRTLAEFFRRVGHEPGRAEALARTALALTRGVLYDLALGGDRAHADATIAEFLDHSRVGT